MTRLLKFRALCDSCEGAEAVCWCLSERVALCRGCEIRHTSTHERVPLAANTGVCALCAKCGSLPAASYSVELSAALCGACATSVPNDAGTVVPLRDAHAAQSIVFDKMDFSSLFDPTKNGGHRHHHHLHHHYHHHHHHHSDAVSSAPTVTDRRKRESNAGRRDEEGHGGEWNWLNVGKDSGNGTRDDADIVGIDLSYFKTAVPSSVARLPTKRRNVEKTERHKTKIRSPRRR